ncbi:MAG: retropepsin-like aspartic protease [Verrucomicrobiota bacterium]
MIRNLLFSSVLGLALVFCSAAAGQKQKPGAAEYRDFKNASGKTLRARLLEVNGANAILRLSSNGKDIPVAIKSLSAEDQVYIESWDPEERLNAAPTTNRPSRPRPPAPPADLTLNALLQSEGFSAVKMEQEGRSILVDISIDGKPFRFAVDTGQVLTMMDNSVARQLGLSSDLDLTEFKLADGSVEKIYGVDVDEIKIGDVGIKNISLGFGDLQKIGFGDVQGIFGADVLVYFEGMVDWSTMTLYLNKGQSD